MRHATTAVPGGRRFIAVSVFAVALLMGAGVARALPSDGQPAGPYGVWADETSPGTPDEPDDTRVVLGTEIDVAVDGWVSAIRYYKAPGNGGAHTGSLWTSNGSRLATVSFDSETSSGWQTATFSSPVRVLAGHRYVATYLAPRPGTTR